MGAQDTFKTFMRAAFAVEPGGRVGMQLEELAADIALPRGGTAPLDSARDQIVYLSNGSSKLCARGSGSREQIVAFHFGGDIVSVPANSTHAYALIALQDAQLLVFPAREFFDCAANESTMARTLLDRIPACLHRCRDKAVALGCMSAQERLAGFLMSMAQRVGKREGTGCQLTLPMSRRDIGDSLGLTIETVSRQLSLLKEADLIKTSGRSHITIFDLDALRAQACDSAAAKKNEAGLIKFDLNQSAGTRAAITH